MLQKASVFISYSHRDEAWKDRLLRHLKVLERRGLLDVWEDRHIRPGAPWREEIEAAMGQAQMALLLVSVDFLNSDFIQDEEVPTLLRRRESEGLRVLPLILEPCDWLGMEWLAKIQAWPRDGRPLSGGNDHEIETDLAELAVEIRRFLEGENGSTDGPSASAETLRLKIWDPPDYPADPYPLLLPYTHPDLLAGRQQELAELRRKLKSPIPILGLYAPSGAGKSSLLNAGLVPTLRAEGYPVAFHRHPHEPGLAEDLIAHLLVTTADGSKPKMGTKVSNFLDHLHTTRRLAGESVTLVLDQFEDVLQDPRAKAEVGVLLAATVGEQLEGEAPLARWVLAYRQEFHAEVKVWFKDVLVEARESGAEVSALPFHLSTPDRFHSWDLPLLGSPAPGHDEIDGPLATFREAIEAPLRLRHDEGSPRYPLTFNRGGVDRLARAFAEARLHSREAPLTPEFQVVLSHLLTAAKLPGGGWNEIEVPPKLDGVLVDAVGHHLREALKAAFPTSDDSRGRQRRTRALLALRELADDEGRREEGLPRDRLEAAIGEDGTEIVRRLEAPESRLIHAQEEGRSGRQLYVLSHDSVAAAVVRQVDQEDTHLEVDRKLLRVRKRVSLSTDLYQTGEVRRATDLDRREYRHVEENKEAFLWDEERKEWWNACQQARQTKRRRWTRGFSAGLLIFLILGYFGKQMFNEAQVRADLLGKVEEGENEPAFRSILELVNRGVEFTEIRSKLGRRDLTALLEQGPSAEEERLPWAFLILAEIVQPLVAEEDLQVRANLLWMLDRVCAEGAKEEETRAKELQELLLRPFPNRPKQPETDDPGWAHIPGGTFMMGSTEGEGDSNERPKHSVTLSPFRMQIHEVTVKDIRHLWPDFPGEAPNHPATGIDWSRAYIYAVWLGGRLPTEAEWEYACRAGTTTRYWSGDTEEDLERVAWYGEGFAGKVHPVGEKLANLWGIHDMHGNAWEWVADWYGPYPEEAATDPWGPPRGGVRVFRGGSIWSTADGARSAIRRRSVPGVEVRNLGFRVVLPSPRAGAGS